MLGSESCHCLRDGCGITECPSAEQHRVGFLFQRPNTLERSSTKVEERLAFFRPRRDVGDTSYSERKARQRAAGRVQTLSEWSVQFLQHALFAKNSFEHA